MFAGRRPSSSNVRTMQLFYELKQLYPAASDAALNSCIAAYIESTDGQGHKGDLIRHLEEALQENKEDPDSGQMGRPAPLCPPTEALPPPSNLLERPPPAAAAAMEPPKRPDRLDVRRRDVDWAAAAPSTDDQTAFNIRLSERCRDVHKLLNAEVGDKPPPSPSSVRRLLAAVKPERGVGTSPDAHKRLSQDPPPSKKETCSTPTQTTDILTGNLNLSLNVNCSLDLLTGTPPPRRTSVARLVPAQPWLAPPTATGHAPTSPASPRSFTSVNLTLRPPADTPTAPIDITSKNSTLTYSTSSFDSAKGLQSRLQITVGPAGGSVSSVRVRPKSFHAPEEAGRGRGEREGAGRARTGSLDDLAVGLESPLLLKQQAQIEKLRIEMKTRTAKLESVKREIEEIEKNRLGLTERDEENRLLLEIKHLTWQCKDLESDGEAFYSNIYTGQHGPLTLDLATSPPPPRRRHPQPRRRPQHRSLPPHAVEPEGPKWNCGLCTFLNHPVLDKCEQCEMPRILHGTQIEAVNPNVTIDALRTLYNPRAASRSLSLGNAGSYAGRDRPAVFSGPSRSTPNMLGLVHRKD